MSRYLIQSAETFAFLHVSPRTGDLTWTPSLLTALRHGVIGDLDDAAQLKEDHCDRTAIVVDLDVDSV
ncbi:MAG: hypothetical protein KA439_07545 [Rhizobacter sp.]|nr:hypothetical protein [Rhizobacter sp.]